MPTPVSLRCPHCQAPLPPADHPTRVKCDYCGHVAQLQRTIAPHANVAAPQVTHATFEVAYDVTRRVRWIVSVITMVVVLGAGLVVAMIVMRTANAPSQRAAESQRRASEIQRKALEQIANAQRDAFRQLDDALDDADEATSGRARAEIAKALAKHGQSAESSDDMVPRRPDPTRVIKKLQGLDLSGCPGPAGARFRIRVKPNGVTTVARSSKRKGPRKAHRCMRRAITRLRFPKSRDGIEMSFDFSVK